MLRNHLQARMVENRVDSIGKESIANGYYEVLPTGNRDHIDRIIHHSHQKEVFFVHIKSNLHLQNMPEAAHFDAGIKGLSAAIASFPNLKFVLISGDAPVLLVEKMALLDVQAVFVTSPGENIGRSFFAKITAEDDLGQVITKLKDHALSFYQLSYHLDQDSLYWRGKPSWGRFAQQGIYSLHRLPGTVPLSSKSHSRRLPSANSFLKNKTVRILFSSMIVLFAFILFLYIFSQLDSFWARWE